MVFVWGPLTADIVTELQPSVNRIPGQECKLRLPPRFPAWDVVIGVAVYLRENRGPVRRGRNSSRPAQDDGWASADTVSFCSTSMP